MRILIVHPYLIQGGAETAIINLSKYLNSRGIENTIIALAASNDFIKDSSFNIKVKTLLDEKRIKKSESTAKALSLIPEALILRKFVSEHKNRYDIINPHNIPSTWASILHKKPVVWMMNELPDIYVNIAPSPLLKGLRNVGIVIDRLLVKNYVDQICVNSRLTYEQAKKRYGKTPEIVFFGVDCDKYSKGDPTKIIEKYNLHIDDFIVVTVGWFSPQKNQLESIKAIEKVRMYIPKIKLILAGRGGNAYETLLKNYVKSKKLDEHIIFTGFISEEEKRDLYHASHIGLYPFKGQGGLLAPFEHICAGKPVIVSPTHSAADMIANNGLLVTQNYAESILRVYNNYEYFRNLAFKAMEFVKTELTWEKYGERLLKVFERWAPT
jgi:glycosyltransferase involved in cell wall biosynthesis